MAGNGGAWGVVATAAGYRGSWGSQVVLLREGVINAFVAFLFFRGIRPQNRCSYVGPSHPPIPGMGLEMLNLTASGPKADQLPVLILFIPFCKLTPARDALVSCCVALHHVCLNAAPGADGNTVLDRPGADSLGVVAAGAGARAGGGAPRRHGAPA